MKGRERHIGDGDDGDNPALHLCANSSSEGHPEGKHSHGNLSNASFGEWYCLIAENAVFVALFACIIVM